MEGLIETQNQIMTGMDQLFSNFKKDGRDRKTPDYLKRKIETLDNYWHEFKSNHLQLCAFGDKNNYYFTSNSYEKTKEFYNKTRQFIQNYQTEPGRSITPIQESDIPGSQPPVVPLMKSEGTSSKLDEMLRKQSSNFKAFTRTILNINVDNLGDQWEFEDTLKTLQSRWALIDSLHWEIDSELNGDLENYEQEFSRHERTYHNLKKTISSKMWSASHQDKTTPQMDIPTFSGSYQQWTSFKDLFQETIHNNRTLSSAQKLQFLKSKVKGEAERLIQHLNISSENYQISWDILNHRYNNKKLIFSSHINTLLNIPTMQNQSATAIKRLHDTTNECLHALPKLGIDTSSWDPLLIHLLSQKLDAESHNDYIESLQNPRELPTMKEFLLFLETKFTSLEAFRRRQDISKSFQTEESRIKRLYNHYPSTNNQYKKSYIKPLSVKPLQIESQKCIICKENHPIFFCKTFREFGPDTKRKTIAKYNLCRNCLSNHNGRECLSNKTCRHCSEKHNTLLHEALVTSNDYPLTSNFNLERNQKKCHVVAQENISETILPTALVQVQDAQGQQHTLRALIDQGAQSSLITENAAQILRLPRQRISGIISGLGSKENNFKGMINITMSSLCNDFTFSKNVFIMNNLTNKLPNQTFGKPSWKFLENIHLADPNFNVSRQIDILLGSDVYATIILGGIIKIDSNHPIAQETQLGWILSGNIIKTFQCHVVINNLEEIQKFWEIEDISSETVISEADNNSIKFYTTTTKRNLDGRYTVRLPLKSDVEEKLGVSKPTAIAQFRQLERKFTKNRDIEYNYKLFINEYRELQHMIPAVGNSTLCYYMPHHCVQRPDSITTTHRVVFNASAKTNSGFSLNDLMEAGPNLQQDLQSLILKWRQYQYAFTADIEKMFRQIRVASEDQRYQKIIWRDTPTSSLQEYQLTTVTYGTKAAPFLAMMTLKRLASDEKHNYHSDAPKVLNDSFYMDDLLHGTHTILEGKQLQIDLQQLLQSGGFNLRKWKSNSKELLPDKNIEQENFDFRQLESTKTLGLRWNPNKDLFTFELQIKSDTTCPTKRSFLSDISKIFDPLGWLSPVTTELKLIFQSVWQSKIQWDDLLPDDICSEWMKAKAEIDQINQLQLPRWLGTQENDTIELHGFCDASTKAYACVIYCKINNRETPTVALVVGKARLVPINKNITLPRLELCGALLLSKLMHKIKQCLYNYNTRIYGWSDSKVVLGWINGEPSRWNAFIANRVRQITEIMPPNCWYYVKSEENPADCASRGLNAKQLKNHSLWWQGPNWLLEYQIRVEKNPDYTTDLESEKCKQTIVVTRSEKESIVLQLIAKYSSFTRVVRVLAWILRMVPRHKYTQPFLTIPELKKAREMIFKATQLLEFSSELNSLKTNSLVSKKSNIHNLKPFIDKNGLMRVGGRLENACIDYDMKHPIILPHNSKLTEIIIDFAHKQTCHGGARLTSAFIRQSYWIVGGNRAVKKRLRTCVKCRRNDNINQQYQLMGELPSARANPSRPFYHCGIDFTGSMLVKANKGRGAKTTKGYVAVFVCMATKAVHLELVSDLSSSTFLAALRRMAARRGTPGHIYSDNGTNFIGASRILNQEIEQLKHLFNDQFMSEVSEMGIEWHFNAPSWPSAGGLWEAAVASLKYHLKRVIGEQKLTYEEFMTVLTQIEACLNSRPLCPLSEDPEDLNYLTPSHFLSSGPVLTIFETERDERTRWTLTQGIFQDIWKRWKAEYLTQLSTRTKWREPRENIKVDDIVIINDANLPAGKWALGRVLELHPGRDGYVRVVTLKTKSGIIKRPVVKLSVLPVNRNQKDKETKTTKEKCIKDKIEPKKTSYNCLSLLFMLFILIFTPVQATYSISSLQNNQSMYYFDKISNMYLIRDEWKLIVYYKLEPYWQGIQLFNKYREHLETTCSNNKIKTQCDVILLQLKQSYDEYEYYNKLLLAQQFTAHTRRRRGLINGVGYVAHSLFGILDEHFAEQYRNDINLVRENEKHLNALWRNQTSVVEAEYNLIKRVEQTMDKQHKIFNQHLIALGQTASKTKNEMQGIMNTNDFTLSSVIANNILTNLRNIQDTLLDTITNIYYGNFNIHLLKPEQLLQELNIITSQLSSDLSLPITNIQDNLYKIYHLLRVRARITTEYLIFEIKIPLVSRDMFDIYKIIPIPREVNEHMVTLVPVANFVAINLRKDVYLPLSENDVHLCTQFDIETHLCPLKTPLYRFDNDQTLCIKDHATSKCIINSEICKPIWIQLHKRNTYLFSCCGQCPVRMICNQLIAGEKLQKVGLITLGEDCVIKGDSFAIMSHKQLTNNINIEPDTMTAEIPPINNVININIPNITTNLESSDFGKDLKAIEERIKQIKSQEGSIDQISYHDIHHYVVIYLIFGVAAVAGALWCCRRLKARRAVAPVNDIGVVYSVQCGDSKNLSGSSDKCADEKAFSARIDKATSPKLRHKFLDRQ